MNCVHCGAEDGVVDERETIVKALRAESNEELDCFKIEALDKAAKTIEGMSAELFYLLCEQGQLQIVKGIADGIEKRIKEILREVPF